MACGFGNSSSIPCTVLGSSNNTIITNYPCTTSNCSLLSFNLIVSGVFNLYSDQTPITISILSSGYLSQKASTIVTPPISSTYLNNVSISLSNSTIATANIISASFYSQLVIAAESTILLLIDDLVFFKNMDCSYQIGNVSYTGCNIALTANGYISSISLKALGGSAIPANTTISITILVINAYSANYIYNSAFKILVTYNNISVSIYATTMGVLLNSTSFTPVYFYNITANRNTSKAGAPILLAI